MVSSSSDGRRVESSLYCRFDSNAACDSCKLEVFAVHDEVLLGGGGFVKRGVEGGG